MAKRVCPFCKEKVQEKATICKHCKSELPPLPPKKWYQTWKGLLLILFVVGIFGNMLSKGPSHQPSSAVTSAPTDYKSCNVPKKDGSYETIRCNDLEELCKDYIFYRKKILQANQEGDANKVNEYRAKFQQVNAWLSQYNESDIQNTFSRLEDR